MRNIIVFSATPLIFAAGVLVLCDRNARACTNTTVCYDDTSGPVVGVQNTGSSGALEATNNTSDAATVLVDNGSSGAGVWTEVDGLLVTYTSGNGIAVLGASGLSTGYGVVGSNGVSTISGGEGSGVFGTSSSGNGVAGIAAGSSGDGVYGSGPTGMYGTSTSGAGVWGQSSGYDGVHGVTTVSAFHAGVSGTSSSSTGDGIGVYGNAFSASGTGVYGDSSGGGLAGYFNGNVDIGSSSNSFSLEVNGTCVAGGCSTSDRRLKNNIQSLSGSLDKLMRLRPVTFEWNDIGEYGHHAGLQKGFVAQEVEKVIPGWVGVNDKGFKTLDVHGIDTTAMLVDGIQALKRQNDTLKAENDKIRDRLKALEAGRRPMVSGFGEGGIGLGLTVIAGAILVSSRRKRMEARS